MKLDKKIGQGRYNDVYLVDDTAVKLFHAGYKKADAFHEAFISAKIEETGLKVPSIREVVQVDGKWGIVMDYVEGKTLLDLMKEDPANLKKYVDQLVDLQLVVGNKRCNLLPHLRDKLADRINNADIDNNKRYEILSIMDSCPKHVKLCHGDFNPANILVTKDDAYILDWNHATQGNASADVARTYLWFCLNMKEAADLYLDSFCEKSGTSKRYVQQWLPIVAAARLSKNEPGEAEILRSWIDVVQYE